MEFSSFGKRLLINEMYWFASLCIFKLLLQDQNLANTATLMGSVWEQHTAELEAQAPDSLGLQIQSLTGETSGISIINRCVHRRYMKYVSSIPRL